MQKERRQNDKWKEEMIEREKLRIQKEKNPQHEKFIIVIFKTASVKIYLLLYKSSFSFYFFLYFMYHSIFCAPLAYLFFFITKLSINFLLIIIKPITTTKIPYLPPTL